jgi:hypothetical protein
MSTNLWVVFNNDQPLVVCLTQEQADRDVARRRVADTSPKLAGSNVTVNYFHWHEVPLCAEASEAARMEHRRMR